MGVQDYELFKEQLATLDSWMHEAEEALNGQDPTGSSDQSLIQNRMDDLKVRPHPSHEALPSAQQQQQQQPPQTSQTVHLKLSNFTRHLPPKASA